MATATRASVRPSTAQIMERNSFRRPAYANADLSLVKRVSAGPTRLEGRFEVFNVTNRLNVDGVNNVWGVGQTPLPLFMTATSASPPRRYPGVDSRDVLIRPGHARSPDGRRAGPGPLSTSFRARTRAMVLMRPSDGRTRSGL